MIKQVKLLPLLGAFLLLGLLSLGSLSVFHGGHASAAQITNRRLTLEAGATDGGSKPSGVVKHLFTFDVVSTSNLGSIQFLYCTTAAGSCTTPAGLSTTAATLSSQTGNNTGFSLVNTTNGAPYLTRSVASGVAGTNSYELSSVTNPDNTRCFTGTTPQSNNCTFYVRISTFASTDTTGGTTDTGTVAASTATQISLTGTMPESLVFCTGGTVGTTSGVPDCSTSTSGAISFNQLFSPTDTATATSQMAASTNAGSGYNITVNGATLTSGSNTISAMGASATAGVRGTSQFGLNLRANTTTTSTPAIGIDVAPSPNGTNLRGQAIAPYNTIDQFAYHSTDQVSDSGNGGLGGTDAQIFTVSYIVNVPGSQPAGTYTTTLTYICTPTF
jgi:hypothetical protein